VKIVEDAVDRTKSKVTVAVLSDSGKKTSTNQNETQKFGCVVEDGFKAINKTTNQLVMNQVMSKAPPTEKEAYFSALQAAAMDEIEVKRHSMELKKEQLELKRIKVKLELNRGNAAFVDTAIEAASVSKRVKAAVHDTVAEAAGVSNGVSGDDASFEEEDEYGGLQKYNWPTCIMTNLAPELCGTCNKFYLHHVCQIATEEEAGYCGDGCRQICYLCHNGFKKTMAAL